MAKQRIRTREPLLKAQADFHLKQARLPYLKKMKIVDMLLDNPWKEERTSQTRRKGEPPAGKAGGEVREV